MIDEKTIKDVIEVCSLGIWKDTEVLSYCEKRGIDSTTIREWRLGAFPEDPNQLYSLYLKIKSAAAQSVLRLADGYFESPFFKNRLTIPVNDCFGTCIAMMGRTTLPGDEYKQHDFPKYYNTHYPKTRMLFGLDRAIPAAIRTREIYIVEGNLDVITAHQYGLKNVVATSSSSISSHQLSLAARYAEKIILALDADEAGQAGIARAMDKHASAAKQLGIELVPYKFRSGKDLDEALRGGGLVW